MVNMFPLDGSDFLKVRVSVSMLQCTYSCEYCVAAASQSQTKKIDCRRGIARPVWGEGGLELSRKAVEWVVSLPYRVGVRYDVHGEPFLNDEVIEAISWLTCQNNVAFVEVQTNGSMFKKKLKSLQHVANLDNLKLFSTYHHSQVSPENFIESVLFAKSVGVDVIVNVLAFFDNISPVNKVLELCRLNKIKTSADIRYPGFTVPLNEDGKKMRHFLSQDPFQVLLDAGRNGNEVFRIVADSGPLGKEVRYLAAMLVGLYGLPGRECSAGHDYIFVDKWGDVYPCFNYSDIGKNRMGSVLDRDFVPELRNDTYQTCSYGETCHQKEEYGNIKVLREVRNLKYPSLNCYCGNNCKSDSQQLYHSRMAMIHMARYALQCGRSGLFRPD